LIRERRGNEEIETEVNNNRNDDSRGTCGCCFFRLGAIIYRIWQRERVIKIRLKK